MFVSCSDDTGADFFTDTFTVRASDWEWNDAFGRYEYVFQYRGINQFTFEYGTVTGGVFITERDANNRPFETIKTLPFVQSYSETVTIDGQPTVVTYTETISFDYAPGSIAFYVQASDLDSTPQYLQNYTFKINVFYR